MPIIAIFDGIIIQMFFEDHDPPHVQLSILAQRRW
jgi:hypothetical protein